MGLAGDADTDELRKQYVAMACSVSYDELSQPPEDVTDEQCIEAADRPTAYSALVAGPVMIAACKHGGWRVCKGAVKRWDAHMRTDDGSGGRSAPSAMRTFACETYGYAVCAEVHGKMPTEVLEKACVSSGECAQPFQGCRHVGL
jgi:hypothetical protein